MAITADLARRTPTRGDAFIMEVEGRTFTQRRIAGASLLTKIRLAGRERTRRTWTVGRVGGFDLTCAIQAGGPDGRLETAHTLERTDFAQSIGIDSETTQAGLIARLEHVLDRMDADLLEQRRRAIDAKARLTGYEPRLGETFPLRAELDDKLTQLSGIEADLAHPEGVVDENHPPQAASV